MSLRTRVNGFTSWINLRLKEYDVSLSNVMLDLMTGTNLKLLIESMTGRDLKNLQSLDGLTQQQKVTRAEWIVKELKQCNVIAMDIYVDARLFAMRSADHVFDFLWRLVSHDIWFIWERAEYLQHNDPAVLVKVPFKWISERVKTASASKKPSGQKSILSGFGGSPTPTPSSARSPHGDRSAEQWPGAEICKGYKSKKLPNKDDYPRPSDCILELVNSHLRRSQEGQKIMVSSIDDLADHRVLCCLINSFVPHTFTNEVLPNDRWTINLCLEVAHKMFHGESAFSSADLVEADTLSVCAYFAYFFMIAYKYRQAKSACDRVDFIHQLMRENAHEQESLAALPPESGSQRRHAELYNKTKQLQDDLENIEKAFDLPACRNWVDHVLITQKETHKLIRDKIAARFDTVVMPRNITINDIALAMNINLSLTGGSAFYMNTEKEQCTEFRRIVLRNKATGEYIDDYTARNKEPIRKFLRLRLFDIVEVNPQDYPQYDFFFEAPSKNKLLKAGSTMLYQVFPGNHANWHRQFIKAIKENEVESVKNIITFFKTQKSFINAKEPHTGNTALHWACRMGCYSIALYLLENGASINALNNFNMTPLFSAVEGMQRKISCLLIEWGCNVNVKSVRGITAFESIKNDEFRHHLIALYERFSLLVPKIIDGDTESLQRMVKEHVSGVNELCSLRSRCVNGSTLLHTAAYFGQVAIIKSLLSRRVVVNISDYKGATPLHRVRNTECMKALVDAGALINIEDDEGNSPLHVKCYGESGQPTELDCIDMLINNRARLLARNQRSLMPIHCCAMQGRIDALQLLCRYDEQKDNAIRRSLQDETSDTPPSLLHLAIANDHLKCAEWLIEHDFKFKEKEPDLLVERVLTESIKSEQQAEVLSFLFRCGAAVNPQFPGGNTALHFAAMIPGNTEVLELLLSHGADIDAPNADHSTPLFFSCQTNNMFAASVLIRHGANFRIKNNKGVTALDLVADFDEWIECGYFSNELIARLKAYSLKHSRDLVRAISQKVQPGHQRQNSHGKSRKLQISKALLKPISPPPFVRDQTRPVYVTKSLPALLPIPRVPQKRYPNLLPNGSYVMF